MYSLQNFKNEECIGIYSGFVKNHCKSTIFSIDEKNQSTYPWPNDKNYNGNGIHLACDVKWKRNKFSNLLDSCIAKEKQFENNRCNIGTNRKKNYSIFCFYFIKHLQ